MADERPMTVTIDHRAIEHLIDFCLERNLTRLLLVMDQNTRSALGERTETALREAGLNLITATFEDEEVAADAAHIFHVMLASDRPRRTCVAVGSGTITDITRFVSHRTGVSFISMPTAPSVDGFASVSAPLIVDGIKSTAICHAPVAIFADVNTLAEAPMPLIAAGFGDMLGKYTSVADWRLGKLLWDEPYEDDIAQRTLDAVQYCADRTDAIAEASPDGVRILLEGLIESGHCLREFGESRPASGAEHHYSHLWEMKLLREGRPAILHGAKVGVATILIAEQYAQLRGLTRAKASRLLNSSFLPDRGGEIAHIEQGYGDQAHVVLDTHSAFLDLTGDEYNALKRRILDNWDEIQRIAALVPSPESIAEMIARIGGPTSVAELGLTAEEQKLAEQYGHFLRNRFTVRKLMRMLYPTM